MTKESLISLHAHGKIRRYENGTEVTYEILNRLPIHQRISSVAYHEAAHATVGHARNVGIHHASIIPKRGSLGRVAFARFDAPAAAAPHAIGCEGTSEDLAMIRESGESLPKAIAVSRSILQSRRLELLATASALDRHGYLRGSDIAAIARAARRPKVRRTVRHASGRVETKTITFDAHALP